MKKLILLFSAICLTFVACSNDETTLQEDSARLDKMIAEITEYSQVNTQTCTDPDEWAFTKFGNTTCSGYILYSKKIDVTILQKKIDNYLKAKANFDVKWGVVAIEECILTNPPTGVECVDAKPKLVYANGLY